MKTQIIYLSGILFLISACSSSPKSSHQINCEKLQNDSQAKLEELQKIFNAYQEVNYELTNKLIPPLRSEVVRLDQRVKKQKSRCWANETLQLDKHTMSLKESVVKLYGDEPQNKRPLRPRMPASAREVTPAETAALDVAPKEQQQPEIVNPYRASDQPARAADVSDDGLLED